MHKLLTILAMTFIFNLPLFAQEIDDEAITARIVNAIENDAELNGSDIFVVSVNGYVLLAGQALSSQQKQKASIAVAFASQNMRRLINELEVVNALDYSFEENDRAILDQIVEVIPEMSPDTLPVIHNGVVHLLGKVTREEADEVANTISKMSGVRTIRISYEYK